MIGIPDAAVAGLGAQSIQQRPTGIAALLADPAIRQALLGTGAALLQQSDQPGTLGGALGRALPVGIGEFERGRAQQSAEARQAEFEQMLQGLPPEMASVIKLAGVDGGGLEMFAQTLAPPELQAVNVNERLTDRAGNVVLDAVAQASDNPASVDEFIFAREEGFEGSFPDFLASKRSPAVMVTVEGDNAANAAQGALGTDAIGRLSAGRDTALSATRTLSNVQRLQELLDDPAAERVTGPFVTLKDVQERFSDDPSARVISAEFDAIAGQNVLEGLDAFTGAISDAERQFLERIQQGDRSMTVEELRAGLAAMEKMQRAAAQSYLSQIDNFDPTAFGFAEGQVENAHSADIETVRKALAPDPAALLNRYNVTPVRR